MAEGHGQSSALVDEGVELAQDGEGVLERAAQVYGLFALYGEMGVAPGTRVNEVAARLDMKTHQVRRYLALAVAPEPIKVMLRAGQVSARTVTLLQGLPGPQQLELAQRAVAAGVGSKQVQFETLRAVDKQTLSKKQWSEDAIAFESCLLRLASEIEALIDLPVRQLDQIYRGAGGGIGRRSIATLVQQILDDAEILKQELERVSFTKKGAVA